jgi:dienelactone hydrolase
MHAHRTISTLRSNWIPVAVVSLLLACTPGLGYAQTRFEMLPVETITLSTQQFLMGDQSGKPVTLAGELRIPKPGTDKFPAVILLHSVAGVNPATEKWAQEISSIGVATFMLDSFGARGIHSLEDAGKLDDLAMMVDAYRALGVLAEHPRIDANRIAVMGFSMGGVAALYSSNERFRKLYGPPNAEFVAHIGLYTPCGVTYRDDDKVTGKPIRLFHGVADDLRPIEWCRRYVERLKKSGVDVALAEYPGAYHAYDFFWRKEPLKVPQASSERNCRLAEGDAGQILNSKTGKPFNNSDPCIEKGATLAAYDEAATVATTKAVKEFLVTTLQPGR